MTEPAPGGTAAAPTPEVLADQVAAAVRAVPGVADLHGGAFGEVATYLPGRRVGGVRIVDDRCEVHIVAVWGPSVLEIARAVQAVVEPIVGTPVDVTVEDVVDAAAVTAVDVGPEKFSSPGSAPSGASRPPASKETP